MPSAATSSPRKNSPFLQGRLQKLRQHLTSLKVDACLIENPVDLLYLTGLSLSAGKLYISKNEAVLFVDGRYIEKAQGVEEYSVFLYEETLFVDTLSHSRKLALDSKTTSHEHYLRYRGLAKRIQEKKGASFTLKPIPGLLQPLRAIKDEEELAALRRSAKLNWEGFCYLVGEIREGVTERELALAFEIFCRKKGATSMAFSPIIAFGKNSAMPHYQTGDTVFCKGMSVLIDVGVVLESYASDLTRFLLAPPKGKHPLPTLYEGVLRAHKAALRLCRPGVCIEELDLAARKEMKKMKLEEAFLHSLGHGLGLEVHEFPRISSKGEDKKVLLQEGMVVTIEPGLYLSEWGGVRYEDTIIVTQDGFENLYPQNLPSQVSQEFFVSC